MLGLKRVSAVLTVCFAAPESSKSTGSSLENPGKPGRPSSLAQGLEKNEILNELW